MGHVTITNPIQGTSMYSPVIGLHYLAHGRFAFNGSENQGEVDPNNFERIRMSSKGKQKGEVIK